VRIELPSNWTPRPYQLPVWKYLHDGGKRAVTRWHRRAGKDDVFLNWTAMSAVERVGNYWYMLPLFAQARKSMWDAVTERKIDGKSAAKTRMDWAIPEGLRKNVNQQEMKITLINGSTIQLVGSDSFNSLVGSPPVGLVFSEYAISNPSAWAYLMPILEENGGWACFNSTPRGKNHFQKICMMAEDRAEWFYDTRTVDDTAIFTPTQMENIRQELYAQYGQEFGEAMFQQEYYVSFEAAVIGAIWADCIEKLRFNGRICSVPHDPKYPVHTAWDIGKKDSTAIWFFQVVGQDIHVINFHQSNHKEIDFYCDEVLRYNITSLGYRYGSQWLPHDATQDRLGQGGKTILQQFIDHGKRGDLGKFKRIPSVSRESGIQAARATFPRCKFDEALCDDGIEALKFYHHAYDDEKKIFSDQPVHDWASDPADAFRYLSLVWKEARNEPDAGPIDQQLINKSVQSISMGSLTKQHLNRMKAARQN